MRIIRPVIFLLVLVIAFYAVGASAGDASPNPTADTYDIVIYGGTSAGIIAAYQAAEMGKSVVVIEPTIRMGGLTTNGLGFTDTGNTAVIGGLAREFYNRVGAEYGQTGPAWRFEPKVALKVYEEMLAEHEIPVIFGERLDRTSGVAKDGTNIISIRMESGRTFHGNMFIDATYEGDLMAAAGVSYTTGREPNSLYSEIYNGIQTANAVQHQLPRGIDPYIISGDPSSGLLPNVHPNPGGPDGAGDNKIQAYNFRLTLTTDPDNRVMIEKPADYNELEYELLFRAFEKGLPDRVLKIDAIPNNKTDINNFGGFSTDYIGANYDYPEADYATREAIVKAHETYHRGLIWTLQNHPRVPAHIRELYSEWGLAKDEYPENNYWPVQLYIREARRMVSDFVMTENHIMGREAVPYPVGMGSYTMDSHNTQRYVDANGHVRNEGDVQIGVSPYAISYGAIVPKQDEATNLLVPVAVSASHIAFGSIRMEPVFMILGQSAATAAVFAIDDGVPVQEVDYGKLSRRLLADGQVFPFDHAPGEWVYEAEWLSYITSGSAAFTYDEAQASREAGHKFEAGSIGEFIEYTFTLPEPGTFEVRLGVKSHHSRAIFQTVLPDTEQTLGDAIDQYAPPGNEVYFEPELGQHEFPTAGEYKIRFVVDGANPLSDGHTLVFDYIKLVPANSEASTTPTDVAIRVLSEQDDAIPGASVRLMSTEKTYGPMTTAAAGTALFTQVAPGNYGVEVTYPNGHTVVRSLPVWVERDIVLDVTGAFNLNDIFEVEVHPEVANLSSGDVQEFTITVRTFEGNIITEGFTWTLYNAVYDGDTQGNGAMAPLGTLVAGDGPSASFTAARNGQAALMVAIADRTVCIPLHVGTPAEGRFAMCQFIETAGGNVSVRTRPQSGLPPQETVYTIPAVGTRVQVIGGPQTPPGWTDLTWWQIRVIDALGNEHMGWVAESWSGGPLLR